MDRFKIDQVAVQSGLTKRTIRYYEEIGILQPPQRSEGGIRYYTQEHIELLKKIRHAKDALGIPLQELQHFISLSNMIEDQRAGFKRASERSEQKGKLIVIIAALNEKLNLIDQRISKIEQVRNDILELKTRAQACIEAIDLEEKPK